jgi:hypothetical protein
MSGITTDTGGLEGLDISTLYEKTPIERLQLYNNTAHNLFSGLEATNTRIRSMFEAIARVERDLGRREEREMQAQVKAEAIELFDDTGQ